jgi:predicted nucleotidyltransferase
MVTFGDYHAIEEEFFEVVKQQVSSLSLYCVTGSLARGKVVPGWSDIDVLLGVVEYNSQTLKQVQTALDKVNAPIKIGVSIYNNNELESYQTLDSKTLHSIAAIADGTLKPRLIQDGLVIGPIERGAIIARDATIQAELMHVVKRGLEECNPAKERELYKAIITIIKIIGRREKGNFKVNSYDLAVEMANSLFEDTDITLFTPHVILDGSLNVEQRYAVYQQVFKWLLENGVPKL